MFQLVMSDRVDEAFGAQMEKAAGQLRQAS
jgi:hypothetical protein